MNSDLLETFVTVANSNNITKSAHHLFVSQATVSHRIKQLEEKLGVALLVRTKGAKQTELTLAGKNFLPLAQSWLNLNNEIENFQERPQAMELTIGIVNSANNYLFSEFYNQLKKDTIDWRLTIKTMHTPEIYEQVRLNQLDIGFPLAEMVIPGIQVKEIHSEKLMVVSKHRINNKNTLFPIDLDTNYQIYINWGHDYRQWHNRFFPPSAPPKFSVDTAKVALDLLDDNSWFLAPYSVCMHFRNGHDCFISKLGLDTPSRILYLTTNHLTEQMKRRQIVLFKRKLLQFIRKQEYSIQEMLNDFYSCDNAPRSYAAYIHEFVPDENFIPKIRRN